MPPSTLAALIIVALTVMPGALYVWSFEREAGAFGVSFTDRVLRFLGASFVIHFLAAPIEYLVFRIAIYEQTRPLFGQFVTVWIGAGLLAALPYIAGAVVGGLWASRKSQVGYKRIRRMLSIDDEQRLLKVVVGNEPAPRAWDDIFSERPMLWIRVRTTNDVWLGGLFARDSYAGGFPNPGDLLIEEAWSLDEDTLAFKERQSYRVYIPADKIAWLEMQEVEP